MTDRPSAPPFKPGVRSVLTLAALASVATAGAGGGGCDRSNGTAPATAAGVPITSTEATPTTTATTAPAPAAVPPAPRPAAAITPATDTIRMGVGRETFTLEVADSPAEHQRGLMARRSMPLDHGMIFVFPEAAEREFWMKNTLIPLDIVYVGAEGRVVSVKSMKPLDLTGVPSDGPAMYAIELNKGRAFHAGVRPGDQLTLPAEILARRGRR